jgi:hypothetical protein
MWARSEVGLSRLPVTEEIAGSNPVGPASIFTPVVFDRPNLTFESLKSGI